MHGCRWFDQVGFGLIGLDSSRCWLLDTGCQKANALTQHPESSISQKQPTAEISLSSFFTKEV
jgi:hypothetical protein